MGSLIRYERRPLRRRPPCTKAGADTSTELPSAQPPSAQTPAPQEGSPALATESLRESGGMGREMVEREEAVEAATDAAAQ